MNGLSITQIVEIRFRSRGWPSGPLSAWLCLENQGTSFRFAATAICLCVCFGGKPGYEFGCIPRHHVPPGTTKYLRKGMKGRGDHLSARKPPAWIEAMRAETEYTEMSDQDQNVSRERESRRSQKPRMNCDRNSVTKRLSAREEKSTPAQNTASQHAVFPAKSTTAEKRPAAGPPQSRS